MIREFAIAALTVGATLAAFHGVAFGAGDEDSIPGDTRTSKLNGSITIGRGEHTGDLSTVNGSIHVGDDAVVGQVSTVNGSVKVESHATVNALNTVNGAIDVRDGAHVHGSIHAVSGGLHINDAVEVSGDVTNVNGGIHVEGAHIVGSIDTSSGGIDLGPNARVDGKVMIEKDNSGNFGFGNAPKPPRVVIEPGTIVKGKLHFDREVKLYVSDRATIGPVEGAEVVKFSGDRPPE